MEELKLPKQLIEQIQKDNVILFAGSGLSMHLGFPNWEQLVINIIDFIVEKTGNNNLNSFKPLLSNNMMSALDVLTQIEKQGLKKYAHDYIGNEMRLKDGVDYSLHRKIQAVFPKIITTNYDHAFEKAINSDIVHKISYLSKHPISNIADKNAYIFKMHGDVDEPDSCVLFESDYEKYYKTQSDQQELIMSQIKSLLLNKTFLFVGFSMNDPYIKEVMDYLHKISGGENRNHYLITRDKDFVLPYIEPILISHYDEISKLLDFISIEKTATPPSSILQEQTELINSKNSEKKSSLPRLSLLFSEPVDKEFSHNRELYYRSLSKYELSINLSYLSLEQLRNIEDGLILIFTRVIKGNIIIEDEYLQSRQISHEELIENISENVKGVVLFVNEIPNITFKDNEGISIAYIKEENSSAIKRKLDSVFYKLLNKKSNVFSADDTVIGKQTFQNFEFIKGNAKNESKIASISKYIDKKLLTNFIGRKTDVENVIRKIIDLEFESKILTIKGSGGIGKTTIIVKAIIELAERNIFNSIHYISCQSITSLDNFEYQLATCIGLDSTADLIIHLKEKNIEKKEVIVLDNFETLLQLVDKEKILQLVSLVCESLVVITTSRQLLDLDFEDVYELRNLTTDEGVELFKKYFKDTISDEELKILRFDIVEELLNNNPLAIKIISKGIPKSKNLELLKTELKANIFKNENINKIFEKPEDINIEKSSSLFCSLP